MQLTKQSHPHLYEALDILAMDMDLRLRSFSFYLEETPFGTLIDPAERELAAARLTPEDLETFAIGEADDQQALVERHGLQSAHRVLNLFFERIIL